MQISKLETGFFSQTPLLQAAREKLYSTYLEQAASKEAGGHAASAQFDSLGLAPNSSSVSVSGSAKATRFSELKELPAKVVGLFNYAKEGKYFNLARAAADGVFITVPENASATISIKHESARGEGLELFYCVLSIGQGASVKVLEQNYSDSRAVFCSDVLLAPSSSLEFATLANGKSLAQFSKKRVFCETDSRASLFGAFLGSDYSRNETEALLIGKGAHFGEALAIFSSGSQNFDCSSTVRHRAPSTKAHCIAKSAVKDGGRSLMHGKIAIDKGAKLADSYLSQDSLLLNSGARAEAMPVLEIDDNDVRATHSSTVSHVDESALFYLGSRGIAPLEARKTMVGSFLESAFAKSTMQEGREALAQAIESKWE